MCVCACISLSLSAPWWWHCRQPSTLPLCPLDQCEGRSQPQVTSDQSKIHDCTDCFNLPSVQMCSNIMAYHGISWHIMAYLYRQILSITITYSQQHEIISYSQISAASAPRSIFLSIVHGELDTIARHCGLAAESKQGITNDYDGCRNAVGYIHYIDTPLRQSCRNIMKYPEWLCASAIRKIKGQSLSKIWPPCSA